MKKLILLLVLIFSLNISAQEKKQFMNTYSTVLLKEKDVKKGEWTQVDCRIFFNYGNRADKIKMYLKDKIFNFTQIEITEEFESYYQLLLMDDETKESIFLRYYKDERYGIMFIDLDSQSMQLSNTIEK